MTPRREFPRAVKVEIIKRARDGACGVIQCERCGTPAKRFEIHHKDMDAMQIDKRRRLTATDGELLCEPCHDPITKAQRKILAKAQRREAKHIGAQPAPGRKIKSAPFPTPAKARAPSRHPALAPRSLFK